MEKGAKKLFIDYMSIIYKRLNEFTYSEQEIEINMDYFLVCFREGLSEYKALTFFNDYLEENKKETIYVVQYNPEIHESVFGTISVHRDIKKAEKAKAIHEETAKQAYIEIYGDDKDWNMNQEWRVVEMELLP